MNAKLHPTPTWPIPCVLTASGRTLSVFNPSPAAISIHDIADHLAKICRFAGAASAFYSVAQHSVMVANLVANHGPRAMLYALLHDAHEAYVGDIPQPMKVAIETRLMQAGFSCPIRAITDGIDRAIHAHVGLPPDIPPDIRRVIHDADMRALATEKRDLMADTVEWPGLPAPWRGAIKPWPWPKAQERFLTAFDDIATMANLPTSHHHAR